MAMKRVSMPQTQSACCQHAISVFWDLKKKHCDFGSVEEIMKTHDFHSTGSERKGYILWIPVPTKLSDDTGRVVPLTGCLCFAMSWNVLNRWSNCATLCILHQMLLGLLSQWFKVEKNPPKPDYTTIPCIKQCDEHRLVLVEHLFQPDCTRVRHVSHKLALSLTLCSFSFSVNVVADDTPSPFPLPWPLLSSPFVDVEGVGSDLADSNQESSTARHSLKPQTANFESTSEIGLAWASRKVVWASVLLTNAPKVFFNSVGSRSASPISSVVEPPHVGTVQVASFKASRKPGFTHFTLPGG